MTVTLTAARQRVADCLARGLSYSETARELKIARDTVKAHVFAIYSRIPNPKGLPPKAAIIEWLNNSGGGGMCDAAQSGIHTASQ